MVAVESAGYPANRRSYLILRAKLGKSAKMKKKKKQKISKQKKKKRKMKIGTIEKLSLTNGEMVQWLVSCNRTRS